MPVWNDATQFEKLTCQYAIKLVPTVNYLGTWGHINEWTDGAKV